MKVFLFIISTFFFFSFFQLYSISQIGGIQIAPQEIQVEKGDTLTEILPKLKIPESEFRLMLYKKYFAPNISLQVGTYKISQASDLSTVLTRDFKKPIYTDATITFLPGWNLFDIEDYLTKKGIQKSDLIHKAPKAYFPKLIKKYEYLAAFPNLEGVLYPDTYRIPQNASIEQVVDIVVANFDSKIYSKLSSTSKSKFYKTLILASIVEKEERDIEEKYFVAGVLSKRVQVGMSLGADATVCYALSLGTSECSPSDIVAGLGSTSPYNTRKFSGLPPSPISNLSRDSWLAADMPKYSDSLYYLHDSEGEIHYGKTLEEHNSNKRKYLGK